MFSKRAVWAAAIVAVAAGTACKSSQSAGGPPGGGMPPTPVALNAAAMTPLDDATEYVATLKSLHSTPIQPQIDGQIMQILVKSGEHVTAGQPLFQIDQRRQQAAVSSQEAAVVAAQASVAFARQQSQRSNELLAAGAISKQEQEQAQTALETAEANLKSLQAQTQQQVVQLRYFTVTAPTAGVIGDVPVRVGNLVSSQTVLTTIDQNGVLEVYVNVPIEKSGELKLGLPIRVMASDGGETLAETKVNFISPRVDDQSQSILVKGQVTNPSGSLRSEQYVRARVIWRTTSGLVVPVTAVLRISGQLFAFVAEDAPSGQGGNGSGPHLVARQRAIKVGAIVGDNYPVLDGLKPGDRVVTSGVQKLADGAPIQPTT